MQAKHEYPLTIPLPAPLRDKRIIRLWNALRDSTRDDLLASFLPCGLGGVRLCHQVIVPATVT